MKHKEMELPKLRLWARMIANGVHESTEEPPNVPMITGTVPKRAKRESLHDVVVDAAKAMAQAFTGSPSTSQHVAVHNSSAAACTTVATQPTVTTSTTTSVAPISPSRLADVRMKHYEQLRYLHKMFDDGILRIPRAEREDYGLIEVIVDLHYTDQIINFDSFLLVMNSNH